VPPQKLGFRLLNTLLLLRKKKKNNSYQVGTRWNKKKKEEKNPLHRENNPEKRKYFQPMGGKGLKHDYISGGGARR